MLFVGFGEQVPALTARHEVEIRDTDRRVQRRLDAGAARIADRPGRQALVEIGVEGRVDPQLAQKEARARLPSELQSAAPMSFGSPQQNAMKFSGLSVLN